MTGRVHSFQSLGTVDGPGVRFVVFFQGCNLRCKCCHNPDTWSPSGGNAYSAQEIVSRVKRFRSYFGREGGITLSGGEPLLQAEFAREIFTLCHAEGIHTCLDTSGSILNDAVRALLAETDRVLLDIKYTSDEAYRENVRCPMETPMAFLDHLDAQKIPTTIRQVIIPTVNDDEENILALRDIVRLHSCVDKVELLPFRKICTTKYENMGIPFPFGHLPEAKREDVERLKALLN
ncbi:MAG: pyruvate formate lyase-activating protein [Clostridia bacterium]|nr:pyruvate formate lyase-activating protein [Clostridia bacterium]